jgi:hypothetical protein
MNRGLALFEKELARDLGRELTRRVAAEELPYFDDLAASASPHRRSKDRTLGFGVEDLGVSVLSAFLLQVAKELLAFLWEHGKDAAGKAVKKWGEEAFQDLIARVKAWLQGQSETAPIVLSSSKTQEMLGTIDAKAVALGLGDQERTRLREALSSLVKIQ